MTNPQIDLLGTKRWYNAQGKFHREDGPAIEWADGDNRWFYEGERIK